MPAVVLQFVTDHFAVRPLFGNVLRRTDPSLAVSRSWFFELGRAEKVRLLHSIPFPLVSDCRPCLRSHQLSQTLVLRQARVSRQKSSWAISSSTPFKHSHHTNTSSSLMTRWTGWPLGLCLHSQRHSICPSHGLLLLFTPLSRYFDKEKGACEFTGEWCFGLIWGEEQ